MERERLTKPGIPTAVFIVTLLIVGAISFTFGIGIQNTSNFQSLISDRIKKQKTPDDLDYSSVEDVYDKLRAQYNGELDEDKLLDGL